MSPAFGKSVLCSKVLNDRDRKELLRVAGDLGPDPSSKDFTLRTKSIGYVVHIDGEWFQLNRNYFQQAQNYNKLSGGYRRYYKEFPREFIESKVVQRLLDKFQKLYSLPDGELILLHIQTSIVHPQDKGRCLTGHGIHTDGTDRAMLLCLTRNNVKGALNSFYGDHEGNDVIRKPFVLEEGYACFWEDNKVYHHVDSAEPEDGVGVGERTVMVATYPGKFFLYGTENPNNSLKRSS